MSLFLASDVIYQSRVMPMIDRELQDADIGDQRLQGSQFLPGRQWLDPTTVADALGQQLSSGGDGTNGGEPAPGLHGTRLDSVTVGRPDARPRRGQPADLRSRHRVHRQLHEPRRERRGRHPGDVLKIEGGPEPIQVRKTVPTVAAGAAATATLGLPPTRRSARR